MKKLKTLWTKNRDSFFDDVILIFKTNIALHSYYDKYLDLSLFMRNF